MRENFTYNCDLEGIISIFHELIMHSYEIKTYNNQLSVIENLIDVTATSTHYIEISNVDGEFFKVYFGYNKKSKIVCEIFLSFTNAQKFLEQFKFPYITPEQKIILQFVDKQKVITDEELILRYQKKYETDVKN